MRGQVPKLARVTLETITPLHVGAGEGEGDALEDECLGGRAIPNDYQPDGQTGGDGVVRIYRRWSDRDGLPYVPGSTLRGFLRALYAGALDARGVSDPDGKADEIFGSTDEVGAVALDDLLPEDEGAVPVFEAGKFSEDFVGSGVTFTASASYVADALPRVLRTIFSQSEVLVKWLCTSSAGEKNPEVEYESSPIYKESPTRDALFRRDGDRWSITWKMGRFAKSYARALSTERRQQGGTPHDYYFVGDQVPGWVQVTFDLARPDAAFRLNEWPEEGR
jgi:CRISPR/Cas system CSM-associated protein Csm3 (group 7 of RAMP superfamily)